MLKGTILCFALLLVTTRVPAQRSPLPTEAGLKEISERGRMLAEYDAAARYSRSAVLALQPEPGTVGRHVARKVDTRWVVVYGRLNEAEDRFLITYEAAAAESPDQFKAKKFDPPEEDKEFYLSGARAIEKCRSIFAGENRPYKDAVLPTNSGQFYVYIYPAQTEPDVYPLGGDVRYLVSADGTTIQETRPLHKVIDSKAPIKYGQTKEGDRLVGLHNHILDDVPEDTDVFFTITRKPSAPEMVITWEYAYWVTPDGRIAYIGESAKLLGKKKKH